MIIISIFGGLGNQMFQYACGKSLAEKLGVELKLDISHLIDRTPRENFTYRDFELGQFQIKDQIATPDEVRKFIPNLWNASQFVIQFYKVIRYFNGNNYYFEKKKYQYENRFESIKANTYLYGYFQSEKYFIQNKYLITNSFKLKNNLDIYNNTLLSKINSENSVSVHIRRGDFLQSSFNLLDVKSYYEKAIDFIQNKIENPVFYFFTNDFEWTKENFDRFDINKTIINHNNGDKSYIDMILMSNCKHNICANSSFSWWGAWLNQNQAKIVITPKQWFKNANSEHVENDLIPESWLKI